MVEVRASGVNILTNKLVRNDCTGSISSGGGFMEDYIGDLVVADGDPSYAPAALATVRYCHVGAIKELGRGGRSDPCLLEGSEGGHAHLVRGGCGAGNQVNVPAVCSYNALG